MMQVPIYVCCHKPYPVPKNELLQPILVGAALSGLRVDGFQRDDIGDNISARNRSYCELTAQYWAWKNDHADTVGFFHYRRYLYPDFAAKRPYQIAGKPTKQLLGKLGYDLFAEKIKDYDLIAPFGENMHISVKEHYAQAPNHHSKDLTHAVDILKTQQPHYAKTADEYINNPIAYFGNIYIMKRQIFDDYCRWLFTILAEVDQTSDFSNYNTAEKRVDGYLAERLFGIYFTYQKKVKQMKLAELPRVHFFNEKMPMLLGKRVIYRLFPPGTRRRATMKQLVYKRKGKDL